MDCDFAEKVSMLIDGELSAAEIESVRKHIAVCAECQSLEKDFLFFRQQIKTSVSEQNTVEQVKIASASVGKKTRFWGERISLPVPVLAVLALVLLCFGAWVISSRFGRTSVETATQTPVKKPAPKTANTPSEVSLASYDAGGRAEIYVAPRQTK